ncbi:hypothetical protein AAE478_001166 [Parahypoxylon ruwenzoriense]
MPPKKSEPSKKPDNGKDKSKKSTPGKATSRKRAAKANDVDNPVDPNREPAKEDAIGVVLQSGHFRCGENRGGRPCHATTINRKKDISSHYSKFHKDKAAYIKNQRIGNRWPCPYKDCEDERASFNRLVSHVRDDHGHRGSSDWVKDDSKRMAAERGHPIDSDLNEDEEKVEQVEEEEESLFVTDSPPSKRPRRESPDGPGPSGGAGGSAPIAAC